MEWTFPAFISCISFNLNANIKQLRGCRSCQCVGSCLDVAGDYYKHFDFAHLQMFLPPTWSRRVYAVWRNAVIAPGALEMFLCSLANLLQITCCVLLLTI